MKNCLRLLLVSMLLVIVVAFLPGCFGSTNIAIEMASESEFTFGWVDDLSKLQNEMNSDNPIEQAKRRFNLLYELKDKNRQLYAISNQRLPPALALFCNEKAFIFNWECDTYRRHQMMLKENFDGSGNDELFIAMTSGSGTGISLMDLHVIHFFDTRSDGFTNTEYSEYSLTGAEFRDWFKMPITLKEPTQKPTNTILFAEKEYNVDKFDYVEYAKLKGVVFGERVQFEFDDSGAITLKLGVCADYEDCTPINFYIGAITAKVHFDGRAFSFSDYSFTTDVD